jgi:hypothetical protein
VSSSHFFPPERVEIDVCPTCHLVGWSCACDPSRLACLQDEARLQRARRSRLTAAELSSLEVAEEDMERLERGRGGASVE